MKRSPFRGEVGFIKGFVSAFSIPRVFQGVISVFCVVKYSKWLPKWVEVMAQRERKRDRERE